MALPSLDEIACRLGTDKSTLTRLPTAEDGYPSRPAQGHGYTMFYEHYFGPRRFEELRLLEIGVLDGRSLATWKEYFPHAQIYGLDIDPSCRKFEQGSVKIIIGSQADPGILALVRETAPDGFDIIIDDGSHYIKHIIASFGGLFEHVRPGGIYVIEDLHVASCIDWGRVAFNRGMDLHRESGGNDASEMISFLKGVRSRRDVCELVIHLKKICFIQKEPIIRPDSVPLDRGDSLQDLHQAANRSLWKRLAVKVLTNIGARK